MAVRPQGVPWIFTSRLGEAGLLVQPTCQRDRRRGVVGNVWGDLQRHIPVPAGGAFPLRPDSDAATARSSRAREYTRSCAPVTSSPARRASERPPRQEDPHDRTRQGRAAGRDLLRRDFTAQAPNRSWAADRPGRSVSPRQCGAARARLCRPGKNRSGSASRQAASSRQLLCTVIAPTPRGQHQQTMRRASRGGQPWHTSRAI